MLSTFFSCGKCVLFYLFTYSSISLHFRPASSEHHPATLCRYHRGCWDCGWSRPLLHCHQPTVQQVTRIYNDYSQKMWHICEDIFPFANFQQNCTLRLQTFLCRSFINQLHFYYFDQVSMLKRFFWFSKEQPSVNALSWNYEKIVLKLLFFELF